VLALATSRQSLISDPGFGIYRNPTIEISSNLEETLRTHQRSRGEEIKLFLVILCREIDALGSPGWLHLEKREKGEEIGLK